jgi:hypothetical protein
VNIDKHYKTDEGSLEQISVVGRGEPEKGGHGIQGGISELRRPCAYDGKTGLTIGPRERRVLVLPAVELGVGETLQTVVTLEYKVEEKRDRGSAEANLIDSGSGLHSPPSGDRIPACKLHYKKRAGRYPADFIRSALTECRPTVSISILRARVGSSRSVVQL